MIKKISVLFIHLLIICSCSNNIELKIDAKELFNKGFKDLKTLDSRTIESIINNFENVTGIDELEKIIRMCPIDSIRNNYDNIKIKHINDFRQKSKFYAIPIVTKSINLDCFLVMTSDTIDYYYKSLKIFYSSNKKGTKLPILILEYSILTDGLSNHQTNSECIIYDNKKIISKFISINEALDLPDFPPDTIIKITELEITKNNFLVLKSN